MENGAHRKISEMYDRQIQYLKEQIKLIRQKQEKAINELKVQCIQEHGAHLDDGSMFYGFCERCGECLG